MKRRVTAPTASLAADALKPWTPVDPRFPYELRRAEYNRWLAKRSAWVALREAHAAEHGWPGGELARIREEDEAHPIPDAPFDPLWEIEHGDL